MEGNEKIKRTWLELEGTFAERQHALSDELCACGCGQRISNRAAKSKALGKTAGYIKGHGWKGKKLPEATKKKMRENHIDVQGKKNPNYGKGLFGEANPNWQGGKVKFLYIKNNPPGIGTKKDLEFRRKVRNFDGKCVLCGNISKLEMHHIEPWVERPELRFDAKNCVTLCKSCHARVGNAHHKEEYKPVLQAYRNMFPVFEEEIKN